MAKHEVDSSVVVWAVQYLLSTDAYELWDGVRLIYEHAKGMSTYNIVRLYETVDNRLVKALPGNTSLIEGLSKVKEFLQEILQQRTLEYRLEIP